MKFFIPLTFAVGLASAVKLDTRSPQQRGDDRDDDENRQGVNQDLNAIIAQLQAGAGNSAQINEIIAQLQSAGGGQQDLNAIIEQLQNANGQNRNDDDNDDDENRGNGQNGQNIDDLIAQLQNAAGGQGANIEDLLNGINTGNLNNLDENILNQFLRQQNVNIPGLDLSKINLNNRGQVLGGIQAMLNQLCLGNLLNNNVLAGLNTGAADQVFLELLNLAQLQSLGFLNQNDILGLLSRGGQFQGGGGFNLGLFKRVIADTKKTLQRSKLRRTKRQQQADCNAILSGTTSTTTTSSSTSSETATTTGEAAAAATTTETSSTSASTTTSAAGARQTGEREEEED